MTGKREVGLLSNLAVNTLMDALQNSLGRIDSFIASGIQKQEIRPVAPSTTIPIDVSSTSGSGSNHSEPNEINNSGVVLTSSTVENANDGSSLNQTASTLAALQMMKIRRYAMESIQENLQPLIMRHVISRAIESRNIPLVKLALKDRVSVLDFRALDDSICRCTPDNLLESSSNSPPVILTSSPNQSRKISADPSMSCNSDNFPLVIHCLPPDEFDWFSRDRLGKIISMPEACELFSIIGMSQTGPSVQELYINSRRDTFWACSQELIEMAADSLLQMTSLSTLVLRGMADDTMLQLVGQTARGLRRLDVSGSKFVTDEGIKHLFFKEVTENTATYLIKTWIQKNTRLMNPLVFSLETLDYSWTSVTALSRTMVQLLPGSYMFKRVFARSENDSYGHHIFIRREPVLSTILRPKSKIDKAAALEDDLTQLIGLKGSNAFLKLIEQHPWKNCILSLHIEQSNGESHDLKNLKKGVVSSYGIITPNLDERRIHGVVNFQNENLTEIYSVYPININLLGESCNKLRVFRGILNNSWRMKSSLMPELSSLDMFADPKTIQSILEFTPNLKNVRIRVIRQALTDQHIISTITTSMCRRTLEELWIAPGSYKSGLQIDDAMNQISMSAVDNKSHYPTGSTNPSRKKINKNTAISGGVSTNEELQRTGDPTSNCPIDDLVNLSLQCIRALITSCVKLRRIGDIAWWTPVSQEDLETICNELKRQNSRMSIVWENNIFPN